MNYQLAVVGGLTVLALFAHGFGGIRQSLSVEPAKVIDKELANFETLEYNWVQTICASQLIAVNLLVLSALLFFLAFTDVFLQMQLMDFTLAAFYIFVGLLVAGAAFYPGAKSDRLPVTRPWGFWFGYSDLIYRGSLFL